MLNRHHLRIKAMQALYAFENTRETELERTKKLIYDALEPSWTEKAYIDVETLTEQRAEAQKYFLQYFDKENDFLVITGINSKVRFSVLKGIQAYQNAVRICKEVNYLNLVKNTEKLQDTYLKFLCLISELSELVKAEKIAVQESHIRKYKETGDFKMGNNAISQVIQKHDKLQVAFSRKNISWKQDYDYLKEWYITQLKTNEKYNAYHNATTTSFEEDKEMVLYLFSDIIFGKKSVYHYTLKDCNIPFTLVRNLINQHQVDGALRLIENAAHSIARSFLGNIDLQGNEDEHIEKLTKILQYHIKKTHEPIRKDAQKVAKRRENAIKAGELMKEERPENLVEHSLRAIVDAFSQYLSEQYLHDANLLTRNTNAINTGIAKLLDIVNIEWDDKIYVLLQSQHDTINSQMHTWGASQMLHWDEDVSAIENMVIKTIKNIQNDLHTDFELHNITKNWGEDKTFMQDLYLNTIKNEVEYEGYIQEKSQNWHISRFAKIDKVILKMSICELIHATSIPVKVSINEYIEIAKKYSTQKSKNFINGIIDVVVKELTEKKIIRKSGLGMIDNK